MKKKLIGILLIIAVGSVFSLVQAGTVIYSNGTTNTQSIPANSVLSLYTPNEGLPSGNVMYSAKVVSTNGRPLMVTVNQSSGLNRASSYNGFRLIDISNKAYAPIVYKQYSPQVPLTTSVTCQNLDPVKSTKFRIRYYYNNIESLATTSPSIGPNSSHVFNQATDPNIPSNLTASAIIDSYEDPVNLACIVNQDLPGPYGDYHYSYNAIKH